MAVKVGRSELEAKLKEWEIEFSTIEHPEVYRVMSLTKIGQVPDVIIPEVPEVFSNFNYLIYKGRYTPLQTKAFTVEEALPHISHLEGVFAKNLFLRDKKRRLYLLCAPHDAEVKLADVTKLVGGSGCLRLADEKILEEKLGLTHGSVTLFGIINDVNNDVQLVLDAKLLDGSCDKVLFHPMINSATTSVTVEGIKTFLQKTNHEAKLVTL